MAPPRCSVGDGRVKVWAWSALTMPTTSPRRRLAARGHASRRRRLPRAQIVRRPLWPQDARGADFRTDFGWGVGRGWVGDGVGWYGSAKELGI